MIKAILADIIRQAIVNLHQISSSETDVSIANTSHGQFGDYTSNVAFGLAKRLKMPPQELASSIAGQINDSGHAELNKAEAVGGYINLFLSQDFLHDQLRVIHKSKNTYGQSAIGKGKKIIVEYSQPNIAKKMHIGHLRTTVLGDTLANVYETTGHKTIRWNYLGDWGTQFGKLIAAYKLWGSKKTVTDNPIQALLDLYVRFHQELKNNSELEELGRAEFKKLENGDRENLKLWKWFKKESLKEFNKIYKMLDIKFDIWIGESFYENDLKELITELIDRKIAVTGEGGAIIIQLPDLPPALVRKSDGASLYLTREIAGLRYRIKKYNPDKILHVVANEQALYFQQFFATAKILGVEKPELVHVKYGLVLGENKKKMATREGESVPLEEVLGEAVSLAKDIIEKKNPNLSKKEKESIAKTVAIGALKYEMLKDNRSSDIIFDWNRMLDFTGNSGPYLQYTYARLASIKRKSGKIGRYTGVGLTGNNELVLIKKLIDFPQAITSVLENYAVNNLALYLYELANLANAYYESTPILKDEDLERRTNRLILIGTIGEVLKKGLGLLGIQTPERI